jgi:hypothetical protein
MKTVILMFFFTFFCNSQTISKQVIGTAGKTQSSSNLRVSWTSGEPVVGLMTAGGNQLGNGYYPAKDLQALTIQDIAMDIQIKVFPNPTSQIIYVSHPDINSFLISILDLNGKLLYTDIINKDQPVDFSAYTQGVYFINIENKESKKKNTYKIIKN